jgi:hypothetical protein
MRIRRLNRIRVFYIALAVELPAVNLQIFFSKSVLESRTPDKVGKVRCLRVIGGLMWAALLALLARLVLPL